MDLIIKGGVVICALAYLSLAGLAYLGRSKGRHIVWLQLACVLTVVWAMGQWPALENADDERLRLGLSALEVVRALAWVGFLASLIGLSRSGLDSWLKSLIAAAVILPIGSVAAGAANLFLPGVDIPQDLVTFGTGTGIMLLMIVGLLNLENLYRNAGHDQRWGTLYLCLGVALFLAYDFFFYAESLLFKRLDHELSLARTLVTAIAVPPIALALARVRYWSVDVHVSRQMVFHTAALVGAGLYLIAMSLVAWVIRRFGGEAGAVFQISFLALAALLLIAVFSSGSLRSRLRLFIARHFYSSKYDYRDEWLRFITTLGSGAEETSIEQRIVWAVSPIVDSTAAALWVVDRGAGALRPVVSWNYGDNLPSIPLDGALVQRFGDTSAVIDNSRADAKAAGYPLPAEVDAERATWLILPLVYRARLHGLLLLGEPRAPRELDREDENLLLTVASQAASYLAEDRAADALAEARKMEEFNTRFTFIAHDLKNVVNQLALMVRNAEKHGSNPDFQKDMVATVAHSVDRMNGMMEDLRVRAEEPRKSSPLETLEIPEVDLVQYLRGYAGDWQQQGANVSFESAASAAPLATKVETLRSALDHSVQNALDASGPAGKVALLLSQIGTQIVIDVSDNGPGMERDFIDTVYFKPFGTTKDGGYGIGGFQIRQHVRDLGGHLEVVSQPGQGTTIRIRLSGANPAGKTEERESTGATGPH